MEKIEANESTKSLEGNVLFYLERTGGIAGCEKPSREFAIRVVVTK